MSADKTWGFTTVTADGVSGSGNPGATWTQATASAGFSGIGVSQHTSVIHDKKMWVIGGEDTSSGISKDDMWWSN